MNPAGVVFALLAVFLAAPGLTSPLELHGRFLELARQGHPTGVLARRWRVESGDYSFDTFENPSLELEAATALQEKALLWWDQGERDRAVRAYGRAAGILAAGGGSSEAAFCYYFLAKLLAEEERTVLSTHYLRLALDLAEGKPRPFLRGLILQSLASNFWLAGDLDLSIRAFGEAEFCWERTRFPHGQIAIEHNLALLFSQLGLQSRARQSYQRAFNRLQRHPELPEVSFQLAANFSRFLFLDGDVGRALGLLEVARPQRRVNPFEFLLLEHEVAPTPQTREALRRASPPSHRAAIERRLQLARGMPDEAGTLRMFAEALELSSSLPAQLLQRRVELEFGDWLAETGNHQTAEELYRRALLHSEISTSDLIFPFSRMRAPPLRGLVKSLIEQDLWEEAHGLIQREVRSHIERGTEAFARLKKVPVASDDLGLLVEAAGQQEAWGGSPRLRPGDREAPSLPEDALAIELWPDGKRVLAWLWGRNEKVEHLVLNLSESITSLLHPVVEPLYKVGEALSAPPDQTALERLSRQLLGPLEPYLRTPRLLVIPHGDLQLLPFELLLNEEGSPLLDEFFVSYLPPAAVPRRQVRGPPLAILPGLPGQTSMVRRERFLFGALFGNAATTPELSALAGRESSWVHVSGHLSLDAGSWFKAELRGRRTGLGLWHFLKTDFRCSLLTLSTCDAGNSYDWGTPFWLGIAGLLLERNTSSVVVNRWKLAEVSAEIYLDFYRRVRAGASLDVALTEARRHFKRKARRQGRDRLELSHPFFWAGMSYVGEPGLVLYPKRERVGWSPLLLPLLIPLFTLVRGLSSGKATER